MTCAAVRKWKALAQTISCMLKLSYPTFPCMQMTLVSAIIAGQHAAASAITLAVCSCQYQGIWALSDTCAFACRWRQ